MQFGVFFTLLSLVNFGASTLTSEDSKTGVSYELPSSRLGVSPLRHERDRRMTRESRSHSNFHDDSQDDSGQISYTSVREQPSLLRHSPSFPTPEKSTSTYNDDCAFDCYSSVCRWKSFIEARKNLESSPMNSHKFVIPSCHRNLARWAAENLMSVEEPGWIHIDMDDENSRARSTIHDDPFYVVRGKKSLSDLSNRRNADEERTDGKVGNNDSMISRDRERTGEISRSTRNERGTVDETFRKYLLGTTLNRYFSVDSTESHRENVRRIKKYSNILDMRKDFIEDTRSDLFLAKLADRRLGNAERKTDNFDNFDIEPYYISRGKRICEKNSPDCLKQAARSNRQNSQSSWTVSSRSFRDRRGVIEELLKGSDPFYVARGKRLTRATRQFND